VDGIGDPSVNPPVQAKSTGFSISSCAALIVEENVIDVETAPPIQFASSTQAEFFANKTSGGTLLQGYNADTHSSVPEVSTRVGDALGLAL
jgi:hypothetical protein